jgi:hypothetical protein
LLVICTTMLSKPLSKYWIIQDWRWRLHGDALPIATEIRMDIHLPKEVKQSPCKCYCQKWNFPLAIYRIVSLQVQVYLHYPRNNIYKVTWQK